MGPPSCSLAPSSPILTSLHPPALSRYPYSPNYPPSSPPLTSFPPYPHPLLPSFLLHRFPLLSKSPFLHLRLLLAFSSSPLSSSPSSSPMPPAAPAPSFCPHSTNLKSID